MPRAAPSAGWSWHEAAARGQPAFPAHPPRARDRGLVARGLSNRQIVDSLVVSERTAEWHVGNLLSDLGLDSRAQLAVWAAEHELAG